MDSTTYEGGRMKEIKEVDIKNKLIELDSLIQDYKKGLLQNQNHWSDEKVQLYSDTISLMLLQFNALTHYEKNIHYKPNKEQSKFLQLLFHDIKEYRKCLNFFS